MEITPITTTATAAETPGLVPEYAAALPGHAGARRHVARGPVVGIIAAALAFTPGVAMAATSAAPSPVAGVVATAPVATAADTTGTTVATGTVTISGTAKVGQKLTATPAGFDATPATTVTYSYQWMRNGKAISKATNPTYSLVAADYGTTITVKVTAKADTATATATSKATSKVAALKLTAGKVTISGKTTVAQKLTAKPSGFKASPKPAKISYTYKWLRNGKAIKGATKKTYTLTTSDVKKKISVKVTAKATGTGASAFTATSKTSAKTAKVKDLKFGDRTLTVGMKGADVKAMQKRLSALHFYVPKASGTYDANTQQAVWAFQKAKGLSRDGAVGPKTAKAMKKGLTVKPKSKSGTHLEVNLKKQILLYVKGGKVVKIFNVSTGSGIGESIKTPKGTYKFSRQINGMHASTLSGGLMYRPKYFNGGVALHGYTSVPAYPASHGCVRISYTAMDYIWKTGVAPMGETIMVY
ncbi:MAG: L,D-transpeptidase family protein [Cellulomonadaceae bacterium]|jgi:peptidoglycan hydrolase-like protein with peptidoglycan-binding domain|nr:L,D-transpeptidase family protein [Cellulomonadaceae bacterium]